MIGILVFFLQTLAVATGVALAIVLVTLFMDWRGRRSGPAPLSGADSGLFEADRFYIVKLRDGERTGPVRFEGNGTTGNGADRVAFRTAEGRRVILDSYSIRMAEEVDAPSPVPPPAP